ncbi:MAG: hypothetical protein NZ901_07240 [Geminocystis sp.]|nr:hypothetical protein [Geminocystis sp.]MCS7147968.1 hypothetical protein [Geminocystis sp.]MCX8078942.1 hypothetical protein [Geminocystis sp.]MDW8462514.1 hypothetical protein [Geminocystis sp.]HIK36373.1 hypothetical protein [Geminocystis sp. M7585_C2015_104]
MGVNVGIGALDWKPAEVLADGSPLATKAKDCPLADFSWFGMVSIGATVM